MIPNPMAYSVVHVVAQESLADLIAPQVIDPMRLQARTNGLRRPDHVVVLFLEPARVAVRRRMWRRLAALRARAPEVSVLLHAFVGRLGIQRNSWALAKRLRRLLKGSRIVFHCRGETAVEWAAAVQEHLRDAAIVADIRGAWPEEFLFARGFDGPGTADAASRAAYDVLMQRLRDALLRSGRVLSVSPGMLEWLKRQGASDTQLAYVPCCVRGVTFDLAARAQVRETLGLRDSVVITYIGTLGRYQHIEDGVVPFVHAMIDAGPDVHFLALVPEPTRLRSILHDNGVPAQRVTVLHAAQSDVANYLGAADAGLLLRAPSRMNAFSQPTKLGEYLSAGLPVIVSRGTGAVDQMIEKNGAGFVVDVFNVPPVRIASEAKRVLMGLRLHGEELRRNALALCAREFQWSAYTERVREAYAGALTASLSEKVLV
jgi:glycosyltransferase involved in cell wall biosynthesis